MLHLCPLKYVGMFLSVMTVFFLHIIVLIGKPNVKELIMIVDQRRI